MMDIIQSSKNIAERTQECVLCLL